jgi:hypothetical protein
MPQSSTSRRASAAVFSYSQPCTARVSSDERAKPMESAKTITHRKHRTANLAPDASRTAVSGGGGGQLDDERRAAFRTVDGPQRALVLLDDRV